MQRACALRDFGGVGSPPAEGARSARGGEGVRTRGGALVTRDAEGA